jgi:hypothetical protein
MLEELTTLFYHTQLIMRQSYAITKGKIFGTGMSFCWSIGYDGRFYKAPTSVNLQLDADTHESEVKLQGLNEFPLRWRAKMYDACSKNAAVSSGLVGYRDLLHIWEMREICSTA